MWWSSIPNDTMRKASMFLMVLGLLFGSCSYLIMTYNPLELLVQKITEIKPGSAALYLWKNPPYEIMIKVYIFNVTNPQEFLNGDEKLTFNEVGPYVYREVLYHTNISFGNDGTVSFIPRRKLKFVSEYSIGNPRTDTLLLPNVPLLGITGSLQDYSMIVKMAVAQISFATNSEAFVNITVNEYLFGYDDILITLANRVVPNWIDFPRFGVIDRLMALDNGSNIMDMVVDPQKQNLEKSDSYAIKALNGSPGLTQWTYDNKPFGKCNLIRGCYMGTIFPRDIETNRTFVLYRHGFCRPLPIRYNSSESTKYGFEAYTFRIQNDFLASSEENPDNDCYCQKPSCLPKGLSDISPCYYDIPVALSQPHFLNADQSLLNQVKGMSPDSQKHDFYMVINPQSGFPIEAKLRLQINLHVPNTRYNFRTKPFNNLIIPLFWFELSVDNPPTIIRIIIVVLYVILPIMQNIVKYFFALLGVIFPIVSLTLLVFILCNRHDYLKLNINNNNYNIQEFSLKK